MVAHSAARAVAFGVFAAVVTFCALDALGGGALTLLNAPAAETFKEVSTAASPPVAQEKCELDHLQTQIREEAEDRLASERSAVRARA